MQQSNLWSTKFDTALKTVLHLSTFMQVIVLSWCSVTRDGHR